jgi:dinuclear metal center YbgI/SA1388 family protein
MVKIKDITQYLEQFAPLDYQESYDNCGLITGNPEWEVTGILISLDCTEAIVSEAIKEKCNLIIAHHPIWFRPLKKLSGQTYVERTIVQSIKHDVAIYAIHTNLDNVQQGVNAKLAERLGLQNPQVLAPKHATLMKLVTFCPTDHTSKVLDALHAAGAGSVGNYQECAFISTGTGTFKPNQQADPYIGKSDELERVDEERIEVLLEKTHQKAILKALNHAHPYEEVAYYFQELANINQNIGSGMIGHLDNEVSQKDFLQHTKSSLGTACLKHSVLTDSAVKKVAICGGAGSFLINHAIKSGCDAFLTSDLKYHEFFDADGKLLIVDIGHYESEVATKDLLGDLLNENFSKFAVRLSKIDTNPIRYF